MAKTRAIARAERARLAAEQAAEREVAAAKQARRGRRRQQLAAWLRPRSSNPSRRTGSPGVLARRRRRQAEAVLALLVVVNVLVWFAVPTASARALAIVASVLVAPVLHTVLFRRS